MPKLTFEEIALMAAEMFKIPPRTMRVMGVAVRPLNNPGTCQGSVNASTIKQIARFAGLHEALDFLHYVGATASFGWGIPLAVESTTHGNRDAVFAVWKTDPKGFRAIACQITDAARMLGYDDIANFASACYNGKRREREKAARALRLKSPEAIAARNKRLIPQAVVGHYWWHGGRVSAPFSLG